MVDVVSTVSGRVAVAEGAVRFLSVVREIKDANVIAALFDPRGARKQGNERINVIVHQDPREETWWYEVEALEGYPFIRFPVIESGIFEVVGKVSEAKDPHAQYWRWVAQPLPGRLHGGMAALRTYSLSSSSSATVRQPSSSTFPPETRARSTSP